MVKPQDFSCIQIVYGLAGIVIRSYGNHVFRICDIYCTGNGKTHYIRKQLASCSEHVTIAVNEVFSPLSAIIKLRSLSLYKENVGLFFNFTILPPGVREYKHMHP